VAWSTYYFQRSEKYWGPDAHVFNPDRWNEDRASQLRGFMFLPFHSGPRICLGQNMAYTEARVALVRILQRLRLQPPPAYRPVVIDNIVLSFANGLPVRVQRRTDE
jgi:cytochrome P450